MQRLVLVAAAVALAIAGYFLTRTDAEVTPHETDVRNGAESAAGEDGKDALAEPVDVVARGTERVVADDVTPEPTGIELSGFVRPADGSNLDEPVDVVATWKPEGARGTSRERRRTRTTGGGVFAVTVPESARRVTLDVDGEFLALPEPHAVDLDGATDSIVLRPVQGGRIVVRFTGSQAQARDAVPGPGFELVARGVAGGVGVEHRASVGPDGTVRFGGLPSDSAWRVHLDAERFVDRIVPAPLVRAGETRTIEVELERGVTVRGIVLDASLAPVAGANVRMRSWEHFDARFLVGRSVEGTTDDEGRYELAGLLAGDVTMRVVADGFLLSKRELGPHVNGATRDGVDFRLDAGARLTGTVVWPDGAPAVGASVRTASVGGAWGSGGSMRTGEDGKFAFEGLGSGPRRVGAWCEHPTDGALWRVTLDSVPVGDVTLTLEEGAQLTGIVVDDEGTPIDSGRVTATPVGAGSGAQTVKSRFKRSAGVFTLDGVGPGAWDLTATARDHGDSLPVRIEVPLDSDGARIVLPRLASLSGKVVNELGAPIAGIHIRSSGRSDETDEEGAFALEKLQPGEQRFSFSDDGGFGPPVGDPIVLAPGEARVDATVVLANGATVIGEIHSSSRTGTELQVVIRPFDSYAMEKTTVGEGGAFRFDGLAPGTYRVAFDWSGVNDWVSGYRLRREVIVELDAGETERVVLGDPSDYPITVSGEARENGEPKAGLLMYVFEVDGPENQPLMVARTGDDGRYEIDLPRPGPTMFTVGYGQERQARFVRELTDEPEQTQDFDLPYRTLRGRLVREGGEPLASRTVLLTHADAPGGTAQLGQVQFTGTDADGRFEFEGLHPGEYRLRSGNYVRAHATDGLVVREGIVIPEEGEAPEVELVIAAGAMLEVRVTDASGNPLSERRVEVLDAGGWPSIVYDQRRTDYSGALQFTGLGAGEATAVVLDDDGNEIGRAEVTLEAGARGEVTVVCD